MAYVKDGIKPILSPFGLGTMTFGGQTDEADAMRQLDLAFDAGITFFDTAESYPAPATAATQGRSEEILGRWISTRKRAGQVVVADKVTGPGVVAGDLCYIRGANRRLDRTNLRLAAENSLRRLGIDTIDLYQVHWAERPISTHGRSRYSSVADPDEMVAIEETMLALADLVRDGKVRALGLCNETPWGTMRYLQAADGAGLQRIATTQNGYSLLERQYEVGMAEVAMRERLGLIAYSPLAGGTLTGKYISGASALPGSRSSEKGFAARMLSDGRQRAIAGYAVLAGDHGISLPHMALAFVRQQPFTLSVLMAASTEAQLRSNLGAMEITLPPELIKEINKIHDGAPNPR